MLCCGGALRCCGAQSCSSFVGTSKGGIASHVISSILFFFECMFETKITAAEITKNGYTRSSNNHFRVHLKSSTRCAELMFRSTRYWLPLYPELVSSVQATGRRAHTRTRARVHTRPTLMIRISECTHDQSGGIQQSACATNRTHAKTSWTHLRSSQTCLKVRRSVRLR